MSKSALLVKNLQAGKEFTAKQIGASFGFVNPYRAVEALRQQGHCIYGNKRTLSTGEQVIKFLWVRLLRRWLRSPTLFSVQLPSLANLRVF
jgi:hypothetical protein